MKIGLFIDVSNIYFCVSKRFQNKKLNYSHLLDYVKKMGEVSKASAFGVQVDNEAQPFITVLKSLGIDAHYRKPRTVKIDDKIQPRKTPVTMNLAMSVIDALDKLDKIIIVSSDGDLAPLVTYVTDKGVPCTVIGCGINRDLRQACETVEISEEWLS